MSNFVDNEVHHITAKVSRILNDEFHNRLSLMATVNSSIIQDIMDTFYMDLVNTGVVKKVDFLLQPYHYRFAGLDVDYGIDRTSIVLLMNVIPTAKHNEHIPIE